jgi:NAD(P)-dependent dehydrogenase (short-subunit alcohol dehydrogenase family)
MTDKAIALVTGGNKGIGKQIVKELTERGFLVYLGARNLEAGAATALEIEGARAIQLDVTDRASVAMAATRIANEFGRLDVLVNNAGISHAGSAGRKPQDIMATTRLRDIDLDELHSIIDTNALGVVAVVQAMLPLLKNSDAARIVNVTSSGGSFARVTDRDDPMHRLYGAYSESKTLMNAITLALAIDLEPEGISVNAVCPGLTATDLNAFSGNRTVREGASEPVRLATIGPEWPTGTFSDSHGAVPW